MACSPSGGTSKPTFSRGRRASLAGPAAQASGNLIDVHRQQNRTHKLLRNTAIGLERGQDSLTKIVQHEPRPGVSVFAARLLKLASGGRR